jgi:ABC-type arginine transport system permease subunit
MTCNSVSGFISVSSLVTLSSKSCNSVGNIQQLGQLLLKPFLTAVHNYNGFLRGIHEFLQILTIFYCNSKLSWLKIEISDKYASCMQIVVNWVVMLCGHVSWYRHSEEHTTSIFAA